MVIKESTPLPPDAPAEITTDTPEEVRGLVSSCHAVHRSPNPLPLLFPQVLQQDPRAHKITEEDVGAHFRVCGVPVSQGAQGSRKASPPTMQPVAAAD